jgi:putative nucleotidyltransferase with HDIG domain
MIRLPPALREFASVFSQAGKRCYVVGGALRDSLLGRPVSDYDAATDARPEEVVALFRKVIPTGIKHGTVTVFWKGMTIETTTFRRDSKYSDGRRPDSVEFGASLEEDLERRDFTINAMAVDPLSGELVDLHGGQEDLKARLIRAVGDPAQRFDEDGLRPVRAIRFAAQLDFEIEDATLAAIPAALARTRQVSAERIREELERVLLAPRPSRAFLLMEKTGMLELVLPELARCRGVDQKGGHRFDVLDHSLVALDAAPPELEIRLAALLHDIGKVDTRVVGEDGVASFHRHEEFSARMAEAIMRRLKFPNSTMEAVCHLIRQHMFFYEDNWTDAAVRRFLTRVGADKVGPLFSLRLADAEGKDGVPVDPRCLDPFRRRIEAILNAEEALSIKDLALGGEDLAALGVPRGPAMGRILAELLEAVLDDPSLNTKERLSEIAGRIREKHGISAGPTAGIEG